MESFVQGVRSSNNTSCPRSAQRLLVVANRLPVKAVRDGNKWDLQQITAAGGVVSALLGAKQIFSETLWIGWAGVTVQDDEARATLTEALALKGCIPVFFDDYTVDLYYNGFSNNVLWPLFHYIGLPQAETLAATRSLDSQFSVYEQANSLFAQVVLSQYQEGDVIWCHDYHLMCLPKYLKEINPHMKVGFFLHTPFPSSEIYRTLPFRSELLESLLKADLIGFHTYDYARHFVSACIRILGLEGTPEGVENEGRVTRVAAFPVGIDAESFIQALDTDPVKKHFSGLLKYFAGKKVLLGVDRLDIIKGIPQKLLAFEMFLEKRPEWREKVILVQIAVPSRTDAVEYQRLASQVHEIVGRINGRYGTLSYLPIIHLDYVHVQDRSLEFDELCALYARTDVALITSLRDGMNLSSYEFVACQYEEETKGVLVLSEFAGAAQSLGAGAILVNPWNIRELYMAIGEALTMTDVERHERHHHNLTHITTHTAQAWADTFVRELNDAIAESQLRTLRIPPNLPMDAAVERFREAKTRLLIVGFNATITAPVEAPRRRNDQIREMKMGLHPGMKEPLTTLCADPNTIILVFSGSERSVLDETFGEYNLWLAAENGMYLRHTNNIWTTTLKHGLDLDWVESVQLVFEYFCARAPRAFVESRETSLVWNYRYADVEFGRLQARDMLQHLWTGPISNAAVDVVQGSKSVEVRPVGISKGATIGHILTEIADIKNPNFQIDYLLCIGHFLSKDEDVFNYLDPEAQCQKDHFHSIKKMNSAERLHTKPWYRKTGKTNKVNPSRTKTYPYRLPDPYGYSDSAKELDAVMNVTSDSYFSCTVGRKRSAARYSLPSSDEVVSFFQTLAATTALARRLPEDFNEIRH